ncbi:MAG: hypothetical protein IKV41_06945 [Oscillospiraceae bacterium]|nr:hypothetical protein [Oscillospiraceae bacterium]
MDDYKVKFIVGPNGAGKTKFLKDKLLEAVLSNGKDRIATNLQEYSTGHHISIEHNIDFERIDALNNDDDFSAAFEYRDVYSIDGVGLQLPEKGFSKDFKTILTLLCADYDWLFLDEPEVNLSYRELSLLRNLLFVLLPFYKGGFIVTNSCALLCLSGEFLWCDESSITSLSEEDFYARYYSM